MGGGLSHADGVGDLHFTAIRQTRGDDVLGRMAGGMGGGRSTLDGSLPESATTVTGHAAVGVDDDLATGQAAVTHRGRR